MSRYFIQRAARSFWTGDDVFVSAQNYIPTVPDHEAIDTGLIDLDGNAIVRVPLAIGFGRRDEW